MYLTTVLRSIPTRRAIAETVSPLPMEIHHDNLPKLDHCLPFPASEGIIERPAARLPGACPGEGGRHTWGIFKRRIWGRSLRQRQTARLAFCPDGNQAGRAPRWRLLGPQ